ncbi:ATP-dependent helicase [Bilifractor porci]|uniref:DNA 3'-5' helicase n=1 Tax=Bilifractor porci TaxID=2606636 RepID=A0A7X2P777_9FIRM|nr:ATP-dependent helicase [Bilifractor porci]MST80998.1 ATP-dependent helicase [Bilifractor porci]
MQFNEAQQRAVQHRDGPMMVLAGPGSGKTAVVTGRTCRLIEEGISPSSILVVTFTRAAAAEMKERFLRQRGEASTAVTFGTFHGVFFGILRHTYSISGGTVIGEQQKLSLLKELLQQLYPGAEQEADLPSQVGREISQIKGSGLSPENYYSGVLPQEVFRKVYASYEKWKQENRRMDFDDIIVRCWRLLSSRPELCRAWQNKFRYLLVDEFQDISPMQYKIVKLLAHPRNNLFIVGDDDQSIYRFRGANPELMLRFPKEFPGCQTVTLDRNYRSTPEILETAGKLIAVNRKRFPKTIHAVRGHGEPVRLEIFSNPRKECIHLAREIRREKESGTDFDKIAVLVRTNSGCREAVEQMMAWQIPFSVREMLPCIYDHWIAQTLFAYMRLGAGSRKRTDFLRIYNRPNRYFSRDAFLAPEISFDSLFRYYQDKAWMMKRAAKLEDDIHVLGRLAPYGQVIYIRREIGLDDYVKEYAGERGIPEEELLQVLDELSESARNYPTWDAWQKGIEEYREKLQAQGQKGKEASGVCLSTLHAAKGMEYDSVYILDVNEGVIPYHKAVLDADLEEERRMLYVGMTRARLRLHLYAVRERYEKKADLSRFLRECGSSCPDIRTGRGDR